MPPSLPTPKPSSAHSHLSLPFPQIFFPPPPVIGNQLLGILIKIRNLQRHLAATIREREKRERRAEKSKGGAEKRDGVVTKREPRP